MLRGVLIGAGGALGICSQTESLNDVPRVLLRSALSGYDKISLKHNSTTSNDTNSTATSDDLKALSNEIAELKLRSSNSTSKPIVVYGGSSSSGVIKLVILTTTGVVVCYYFGYGFNDIMYVTKATLSTAVKTLEEKVGFLGVKLEKTRNEIFAKITGVEESVFSTSKDLQEQIDAETEKIKGQIDELDNKFHRLEQGQDDIKDSNDRLDSRMAKLQAKFDKSGRELEKANSGIRLLVNSVVDLPHIKANRSLTTDLKGFLSDYTASWFGSRRDDKSSGKKQDDGNNQEKANIKAPGLYGLAGAR